MKKKAIYFFTLAAAAVTVLSGCSKRFSKSGLDKFGLEGNVSSIRVRPVQGVSGGENYLAEFDKNGKELRIVYYAPDSSSFGSTEYTYDKKGRLTEAGNYDPDGEYSGGYRYSYDGKFVRMCTMHSMEEEETARWVYENNGKHIVKSEFYSEGVLESTSVSSYDGMKRTETVTGADSTVIGTAEYVYLSEDKPIEIDSGDTHIKIEYNNKGLPERSVNVVLATDGSFLWDERVTAGNAAVYEYQYDGKGNWIRRKTSLSSTGETLSEMTREIRYR